MSESPCSGFYYGKNPELLQLYNKYKKRETFNESNYIHHEKGVWSTHSVECTNEAIRKRASKHIDKLTCNNCFHFPSIQSVKDRVKRMGKIYHIEQYVTESPASKTGYLEVSNFLQANVFNASSASIVLRKRCLKYISHQDWINQNMSILLTYNALDSTGKVHHQCWLNKVAKIYVDEPSIKTSLLRALMELTLSRYKGDISAPGRYGKLHIFSIS